MCTVDKPFIIVVDVDNKRAFKAYTKGMNDLMDIWPQLMEAGSKVDQEYEELRKAVAAEQKIYDEQYEAKFQVYKQAMSLYETELEAWSKSSMFRGPKPTRPAVEYPEHKYAGESFRYGYARQKRGRGVKVYESIRDELQKMLNLAGAATGPYRMMEGQVHVMIEWENGHRIQQLLDFIKEKP